MKKYAKASAALLLMGLLLLLLIFGRAAGEGVRRGLTLCYTAVLPALFPAAFLCGILGELTERLPLRPTVGIWLISLVCGFPLGIKTVVRAMERGLIDRSQAERLSCCCVNASPAFLITYIGGRTSLRFGLALVLAQASISLLLGLIFNAFTPSAPFTPEEHPLLPLITQSAADAATGCLIMVGYIALFSAAAGILSPLPYFSRWYCFLELTGGISAVSDQRLAAAAVGFSGCSILMQSADPLIRCRLPFKGLLIGKLICGALMPLLIFAPIPTAIFIFFAVLLISFDKQRKKVYNKLEIRKERRSL